MICELYIKNCALIEEMRINFEKKLNILTGETGSGKSIILGALNLCLGGKYDRSFLRKGADFGEVELLIFTKNEKFLSSLNNYGIGNNEDDCVIVSRKIFPDGKSVAKINGKNIKILDLKNLMSVLIDMHGQHQNQVLYNKDRHIEFLDLFGNIRSKNVFKDYKQVLSEYNEIKHEISRLNDNMSKKEIEREIDLLKFQINEIESANLVEGEYEDLKRKRDVYANGEKIHKALLESYELAHNGVENIEDKIGRVSFLVGSISSYDEKLGEILELSDKIMYEMQDLSEQIRNYSDSIDFDPSVLEEIEERLDVINSLRRKYGDSFSDIMEYFDKISNRLYDIQNREEKNKMLQEKLEKKKEELGIVANNLREERKLVAKDLENSLLKELKTMNMKNTRFKVIFNNIDYNENGCDDVEFNVSFNLGENLNPLNKVASGGEMSRFMLAFKSILSDVDKIETIVFDEVDTGISGRAAQVVGEKLSEISRGKQLLCITHLPQIASFADEHFYIEKNIEGDRTYTSILKLDDEKRKEEIARLISGNIITEKTIQHSSEMLEIASKTKKDQEESYAYTSDSGKGQKN